MRQKVEIKGSVVYMLRIKFKESAIPYVPKKQQCEIDNFVLIWRIDQMHRIFNE